MSGARRQTGRDKRTRPDGNLSVIDLFAGAGGLSLGIQMALPSAHITLVEKDPDCIRTLKLNFPRADIIQADVRDLNFRNLHPTILVAGPPCQGFSKLNRNRLDDPRNDLAREAVRAAGVTRPQVVIVENVPGFLGSPSAEHLVGGLSSLGFVVRSGVVNCADYGVPQIRKRALVIAARRGLPVPWPEATHSGRRVNSTQPWRTVGDAFAMLPTIPDGANWHRPYAPRALSDPRYRAVPQGGARRDLPPDLQLRCWQQTRGYSDVLGRLVWDRPATTVRTAFFRPEKGRFLHPVADRPITVREAARLQSFPDAFDFPESISLESVGRQVGNAVPALVARAIGKSIARLVIDFPTLLSEVAV
jgi:DNA (cytosine-5)-methyltransferase 1